MSAPMLREIWWVNRKISLWDDWQQRTHRMVCIAGPTAGNKTRRLMSIFDSARTGGQVQLLKPEMLYHKLSFMPCEEYVKSAQDIWSDVSHLELTDEYSPGMRFAAMQLWAVQQTPEGGLLCIDNADAFLGPEVQERLLAKIDKLSEQRNVQVILTVSVGSHMAEYCDRRHLLLKETEL